MTVTDFRTTAVILPPFHQLAKSLSASALLGVYMVRLTAMRESLGFHYESVMKVDFIARKDTPYRQEEFSRRVAIDVEGMRL